MLESLRAEEPNQAVPQPRDDRWDEVWNGVLHMAPSPNATHQKLVLKLGVYLETNWAIPNAAEVFVQLNVASFGGWPSDYRIPDLVLLHPNRASANKGECIEGPPSVVVEICSPRDESYPKLSFYQELGVPETWIIDRDTRSIELFAFEGDQYAARKPNAEGWIVSREIGVEMKMEGDKLWICVSGKPETTAIVP